MDELERLLENHPKRPEQGDESWDKLLWAPVPFSAMEIMAADDGDENKLTFSFASEIAVARWYGTLTLSCKRGSLLDERIKDNACPFCWEHIAPYDLGLVRKVWLNNRVAYCTVEFNGRMDSQEIKREMKSEMRPNVSPLAVPNASEDIDIQRRDKDDENSYDIDVTYKVWQPIHIATVSQPANSKVGVGAGKLHASSLSMDSEVGAMVESAQRRIWSMAMNNTVVNDPVAHPSTALEQPTGILGAEHLSAAPPGYMWVAEKLAANAAGQMVPSSWMLVPQSPGTQTSASPPMQAAPPQTPSPANSVPLMAEMSPELKKYLEEQGAALAAQTERAEILALAMMAGHPEIAQAYLKGEEKADNIREKLVSVAMNPHMMQGRVGPGQEQRFSIARLARAKLDPANVEYQRLAQHELEATTSLARLSSQGGPVVPFDIYAKGGPVLTGNVLQGKQLYGIANRYERPGNYLDEDGEPLTVTTVGAPGGTSAGNAIATAIDLDRTVDFLVEDSDILMKCDVAMGLVGNVQVPIELTGATIGFTGETTVQGESTPTYGNVQITPHQMSANVNISKQAIIQSSGWIERKIRMLLARQFRSEINKYLMVGTGAGNQPRGLEGATGFRTQAGGTLATLNWADVVDTEEYVDNEWIPEMGRCWVMSNAAYKQHLATEKATNTGIFLLDKNMPLMSYDAIKTSFLLDSGNITPNTPVASAVTAKGRVIFGNFLDQFVGFWDGFEVVVEGITSPAEVKITIIVWWDTVTTRLASFLRRIYT